MVKVPTQSMGDHGFESLLVHIFSLMLHKCNKFYPTLEQMYTRTDTNATDDFNNLLPPLTW